MKLTDKIISFIYCGKVSRRGAYKGATLLLCLLNGYSMRMITALQAQADFETANGNSNILRDANNAFGMRCVTYRKTTQNGCYTVGNNGQFGTYSTIFSSVKDRIYWDKYAFSGKYWHWRNTNFYLDYFYDIKDKYFPNSENVQSDYINYINISRAFRLHSTVIIVFKAILSRLLNSFTRNKA